MDDELDDLPQRKFAKFPHRPPGGDFPTTVREFRDIYETRWDDPRRFDVIRSNKEAEQDYLLLLDHKVRELIVYLKDGGSTRDAAHLEEALEVMGRRLKRAEYERGDFSRERSARHAAESRLNTMAELSKTTVTIKHWSEEMEAWCAHSIPEGWNCVRGEGTEAYFLFHSMESAALFMLHFS